MMFIRERSFIFKRLSFRIRRTWHIKVIDHEKASCASRIIALRLWLLFIVNPWRLPATNRRSRADKLLGRGEKDFCPAHRGTSPEWTPTGAMCDRKAQLVIIGAFPLSIVDESTSQASPGFDNSISIAPARQDPRRILNAAANLAHTPAPTQLIADRDVSFGFDVCSARSSTTTTREHRALNESSSPTQHKKVSASSWRAFTPVRSANICSR
jgi:hypothetical protein